VELAEALHGTAAGSPSPSGSTGAANLDEPLAAVVEEHVRERGRAAAGRGRIGAAGESSAMAGVVVVCAGVRPASTIAAEAGARTGPGGALLVAPGCGPACRCLGGRRLCRPYHRVLGRPAFVPLGPAANKTAGSPAPSRRVATRGSPAWWTAVVKVFELEVAAPADPGRGAGRRMTPPRRRGGRSRASTTPGLNRLHVRLVHEAGGRLLGAQLVGREGAAKRSTWWPRPCTVAVGGRSAAFDLLRAAVLPVYDPLTVVAQRRSASCTRKRMTPGERVAVVTGGASGIGRATCARLRATARPRRARPELRRRPRGGRPGGLGVGADVTDAAQVERAFGQITQRFGRIDVLVEQRRDQRFAGGHSCHQTPVAEWDRVSR